jgi:alanyl-tRNA synthetase
MSYVFNDARIVRNQIEALKALYPEITEDADLLADVLEGETNLDRVLEKLVDFVRDAETMMAAVKARKDEIAERQKRFERQAESGRKIIQQLMESAHQTKVVLPEATLSITAAREKVEVTNVDDLPQGYFRTERKPLSKDILLALKAGEKIPGAELVIGDSGLMIRTK